MRCLLKDADGPPVKEGFLDLGIQQVASNRAQPWLGDKRFHGGQERFGRCARLPLAFEG